MFRQLTKSEVKQIADIMLKQVFTRAEEKGIKIDVTGAAPAAGRGRQPPVCRLPGCLAACCLPAACYSLSARRRGSAGPHAPPALPRERGPRPHLPVSAPRLPRAPAERFKDRLVDEGYNPAYGARPLRRAIMRLLEDSMAERMLAGDIKEGDSVIIDGAPQPRPLHVMSGACLPACLA